MRFVGLVLMMAVSACSDTPGPSGPPLTSKTERKEIPFYVNRQIDILFVVDNSPAMTPHLARLADNYPRYMQVLEALPGGVPDVHIGVVTADVGDPSAAGCTASGQNGTLQTTTDLLGAFISDRPKIDGTREKNYSGALTDVFTSLAMRGDQGCTVQQPLEAAKRALSNPPANAGFLRPDAYLAIIVISATDEPNDNAAAFAAFIKGLKTDPTKVIVTAVVGPSDPIDAACDAQPATHIHALLAQFPNRSDEASICAADSSDALSLLAQLQKTVLGIACWEGVLADVDPDTAGLQPGCAAWIEAEGYEETVPSCTTGRMPCYEIRDEPLNCVSGSHHSVRLLPLYAYSSEPARLFVECLVE